ncbi:MAG: hypothetical protein JWO22_2122, partial [Frankiales bacterium]|nr:hypothetical protein [Frankiales bacterium]
MDGLFRSSATTRDSGQRRVLGLTAATGVTALGAVGGLMIALVPAHAGQVARTTTVTEPPVEDPAARASALAAAEARARQQAATRAAAQAAVRLKGAKTAAARAAARAAA